MHKILMNRASAPLAAISATLLLSATPLPALACATCGCSLSSDAAMGYSAAPGWRITAEYDYIDQSQLHSGTHSISPSQVAAINDAGGDQEVEDNTTNRYFTVGISYAPNADWNFKLLVPYVDRSHTTYGSSPNPLTPDEISGANVSSLGDMKFIVSYQGFLPTHNFGVQLGVKLPTGNYGGPNADDTGTVGHNPVAFNSGPNALNASPDNLLDTSLQAGTGSTDIIVGAYYYRAISQNFDAFINWQYQSAVSEKLDQAGADFRPGDQSTVSFGVRYESDPELVPQLQVNLTRKSPDEGVLADTISTGGTVAYLSPGITIMLSHNVHVFGFLQVPFYSNLDGYQLFPHWTASVGASLAF
ncbi:MAG TPA: transporter [Burkholderiales bacterium]|nr:transporter [Burkholderiales bacterium]